MAEGSNGNETPHVAEAVLEEKSRISLVWLIPVVALVIGLFLIYRAISERGPEVTITFKSAAGLEAEKTKIKYKNVELGQVESINLSDDLSHVRVKARLVRDAAPYMNDKTRFWVVRARVSAGQVSGLGTLFSGAYIGIDPQLAGQPTEEFKGLEDPPAFTSDDPGTVFKLRADSLGSLDVGAPVYYRWIPVGNVVDYQLDAEGEQLAVEVFVRAPHDQRVHRNTRFWNASGVDAALSPDGFEVDTVSLTAMLVGGVAFDTVEGPGSKLPPREGQIFTLYPNKRATTKPVITDAVLFRLYFDQSLGGLNKGSAVRFQGITVGEVTDVHIEFDPENELPSIPVTIALQPQRFTDNAPDVRNQKQRWDTLVARGLRAQLVTANLLTGQLAVNFDYHQNAPPGEVDWEGVPPVLPTIPSPIETLMAGVNSFMDKLNSLPVEEIGEDLRESMANMNALMADLETAMPTLVATLENAESTLASTDAMLRPDSQASVELRRALQELAEAARALRLLAEQLEQNPESLIRGKEGN